MTFDLLVIVLLLLVIIAMGFVIAWQQDRADLANHTRNEQYRRRRAGQPFVPRQRMTNRRERFPWSTADYEAMNRKGKSDGQALVEMALILPILLFILLAIIEVGNIGVAHIRQQQGTNAYVTGAPWPNPLNVTCPNQAGNGGMLPPSPLPSPGSRVSVTCWYHGIAVNGFDYAMTTDAVVPMPPTQIVVTVTPAPSPSSGLACLRADLLNQLKPDVYYRMDGGFGGPAFTNYSFPEAWISTSRLSKVTTDASGVNSVTPGSCMAPTTPLYLWK